jgi:tRNA A-37 threonylcarbamoyl transferase component Bud32
VAPGEPATDPGVPKLTAGGFATLGDPPGDLRAGSSVRYFGDYEIQAELGRGGMGVVYKARQVSLNRPVALKLIRSGLLADDSEQRRFRNEAMAVALLDHPGILPVYEVGTHNGQQYFSMKLVDGGNLADRLSRFRADFRSAVTLLIATADAVQHAHERGILHRDLKPANILVDAQGNPHVTDFGLAKLLGDHVELTASGAIMGTPAYMSPEQADGRRGATTLATDVYGLGAVLYALLTGNAPFGGDSAIETLDAVRTRAPESPRTRNAGVPRDLELICLKCLEKDPADRYPTAGALADDLRRFAAGQPVSVRAVRPVERMAKWARRNPTLAAAYTLGLLAVSLGVMGGAALLEWRAAARATATTARLYFQQKQLADEQSKLARNLGTARDSLVAMVNDLVTLVNQDPQRALPAEVLNHHLAAIREKTNVEFKAIEAQNDALAKEFAAGLAAGSENLSVIGD